MMKLSIISTTLLIAGLSSCGTMTTDRKTQGPDVSTSSKRGRSSGPLHRDRKGTVKSEALPSMIDPVLKEQNISDDPDYKSLLKAYQTNRHQEVLSQASKLEQRYIVGSDFVTVKNWKGLAYVGLRQPALAIREFQRAIDENAVAQNLKPFLLYNLGTALTDNEQVEDSLNVLSEIDLSNAPQSLKVKILGLQGKNFLLKNLPLDSALATMKAGSLLDTQAKEAPLLESQLERALALFSKREEFDTVLNDSPSSYLVTKVEERRLPFLALQKPAESQDGNSRIIGVLIPLSGKYAGLGSKILKAITLGLGVYDKNSKDSYTIHIEDSGDTPERALQGLEALVNQHKVALILGPLLSKGIDLITLRAENLRIPLITLSQYPGLPGEFIHSAGLTPQLQANELARYAIEKLGMKRFAILQPKDKFGEQYAQSFWDAVDRLGGQITGFEKYAASETDFRAPIDALTGRAYPRARASELEALEAQRKELNITKKNRKNADLFELAPIVDFEAVFIPDNPETVGQVLPTFAYRDVDNVKFLGVSTWNSKTLLDRVYQQVEQTYFVDALYLESSRPMTQRFISQFSRNESSPPSSMDAMAYDAALLAKEALKGFSAQSNVSRDSVNDRIHNIRSIEGATGTLTYKDGAWSRGLEFLTVRKRQILPVDIALKMKDTR